MDIRFEKRPVLKEKPDQKNLGFGKYMTDYMFVMDWTKEDGWKDARIVPEGPITMDPACVTLHYAQETFEGMKAYRTAEGKIQLFRPEMNAKRMINSNARLCMPEFPVDMFVEAVEALVKVEADWVPSEPNTSLYIRPFMFATEAALGVHMANAYKFMIICCPVGAYYAEGINPVKILVEDELVRAVKGGTGFTKCGGNYAGSILGQVKAEKMGYSQGHTITVSIPPEAGEKAFPYNATVTLVNPVVSARADATFGGRATADWYINAEDIVLADAAGKPADQTKAAGADAPKTADQNKPSDKTADKTGTDAKDGGNKK